MKAPRLPRWWGAAPAAAVVLLLALRACVAGGDPLEQLAAAPSEPGDPVGVAARGGSLEIARGGPVILGYQSSGPARVVVAGHLIARGGPECREIADGVACRVVLPSGAAAVHVAAPAGARLVWSPVGRRGDPEYVPASSLSADPAGGFGSSAGAAPADGAIALAILAVLVTSLLLLARARLARVPRTYWLAMGGVLLVALLVRLIDLGGFGQAWDEDTNWAAGRNYITNLLRGDFAERSWVWNYEHPPVMKYLEGIGAQLADGFGPARALSALWTAIGCALLVPIGARLYRLRTGVLAALIAALLPPLVAHGQIVGHESPSVMWWTLGILLALGVHDGEPDRRTLLRRLAWVGVVIGVAVASRFVNGLLGVLCAIIVVVQAPVGQRERAAAWGAAIMPAGALLTLYALWPRLWASPISALRASLAKLSTPHDPEPFLGATTNHPGPHYFVVYLLATLPIGALVGGLVWAVRCRATRSKWLHIAWLLVPLIVALSPVRQDGVRYVLPCVVALALAAAAGWDVIATWLEPRVRHAFVAIAAAVVIYLGVVDVRVAPYYLDYFGEQVGGAGAVAQRRWFETAWWGEGAAAAVAYVNAHAEPGAHVYRECLAPVLHLGWFREDLWPALARSPGEATWYVVYAPASHACTQLPADARRVYSVTAGDLVLAEVWQRQQL